MQVELAGLADRIAVYQNGGAPIALDAGAAGPDGFVFLGRYELVGPLGPETPVYVAAR